jgi:hypothetical protein
MIQTFDVLPAGAKQEDNFTIVPNLFYSSRSFAMSGNNFKVLHYFVRNTYGYHHPNYSVGIIQIARDCKMSAKTASNAVGLLLKEGWLDISREADRQSGKTREYKLVSGIVEIEYV